MLLNGGGGGIVRLRIASAQAHLSLKLETSLWLSVASYACSANPAGSLPSTKYLIKKPPFRVAFLLNGGWVATRIQSRHLNA